jgi:hypothetical protein
MESDEERKGFIFARPPSSSSQARVGFSSSIRAHLRHLRMKIFLLIPELIGHRPSVVSESQHPGSLGEPLLDAGLTDEFSDAFLDLLDVRNREETHVAEVLTVPAASAILTLEDQMT